mmetsp:Transcript_24448/g.62144  ORF Transcript_24448/g.62144 Transcript_24448/m.62144 type:complete len:431 (-) Transcript_24448:557-1849(-)|eukprot:CAMPEP_0202862326 /NCGR_PEP_ID=MMETSP1391-20130828/3406_1 /ASSEMBLY_ACC=CAM_ASM_000867 /TAXON_ID=1034604 /ORGANISM="Chlamydomonas leiostraca, Strain SAG 11-49" /LENGTH=430 /DNA_ID=CAMNT_0049541845 /DNA_START=288 /DNA_END=1580 /DNA_ORIENTATION=-
MIDKAYSPCCVRKHRLGLLHAALVLYLATTLTRISGVCVMYVVYHDTEFFLRIIKSVGAQNIDELIVVDGPRANAVPLLDAVGLLYDARTSPVRKYLENTIANYIPETIIKYNFSTWETQKQQRAYGFEQCNHEVMLQCEADMILRLNQDALHNFMKDDTHIAGVNVMNLIGTNAMIASKLSDLGMYRFNLLVKRNLIPHEDYYRSIWIVGSSEKPSSTVKYHLPPVGVGYHLTLVRTADNMVVKYAYYRALHVELTNNASYTQRHNQQVERLAMIASQYGVHVARELFIRSHRASALCVHEHFFIMNPPLPVYEFSAAESAHIDGICNYTFIRKAPVENLAVYEGRVPLGVLHFTLHNVFWCHMTFTDYYYARQPVSVLKTNVSSVKPVVHIGIPSFARLYTRTVHYRCHLHPGHMVGFVELHSGHDLI